jgi:hypothetical protein
MSRRTAAWLAWSLWAVCVAFIGLALSLDFLTGEVISAGEPGLFTGSQHSTNLPLVIDDLQPLRPHHLSGRRILGLTRQLTLPPRTT